MLDKTQKKIVKSIEKNIIVAAGAGSGKTRVITERVKELIARGVKPHNIVAITFTNLAAEEMKTRLDSIEGIGDVFVGTIHSFANKILKNSGLTYSILTSDKQDEIITRLIGKYAKFASPSSYATYKDVTRDIERGKINESALDSLINPSALFEFNFFFGRSKPCKEYPENLYTVCSKEGIVTFNELLIMCTDYYKTLNARIEHLLVDELQDVGNLEFSFLEGLNAENNFFVGDDWQCQPAGTKILLKDGTEKNIEDIQIGDSVITYLTDGKFHFSGSSNQSQDYKVLDKSEHTTSQLFKITTQTGKSSSYTNNHKCFVRMLPKQGFITYIMCDDAGMYRIGMTKIYSDNHFAFGLRNRLRQEKCTRAWILNVFDNQKDAWICEQMNSLKYTIPQMITQYDKVKYSEEDVKYIYSHIGDVESRVKMCLDANGRDSNYPFVSMFDGKHISRTHAFITEACNILPGYMEALEYDADNKRNVRLKQYDYTAAIPIYVTITEVQRIPCQSVVYGLKIEKYESYVADGILTHNSIYGFKGGDVRIFKNLINDNEWHTYYMTNNYRNGTAILSLADTIIHQASDIIPKDITPMIKNTGNTIVRSKNSLLSFLRAIKKDKNFKDWFILVRTNKDLWEMSENLKDEGIPFVEVRRSEMTMNEIQELMHSDRVKLMTVHMSKGLESKNVLLWGNFPVCVPSYRLNSEERKVMYVAVTRCEDTLILLN